MENIIEDSIINSYYILTGKATIEEIISRQDFPILFIGPKEKLDESGLNTMLDYFISTEEYEKCSELIKLKK